MAAWRAKRPREQLAVDCSSAQSRIARPVFSQEDGAFTLELERTVATIALRSIRTTRRTPGGADAARPGYLRCPETP